MLQRGDKWDKCLSEKLTNMKDKDSRRSTRELNSLIKAGKQARKSPDPRRRIMEGGWQKLGSLPTDSRQHRNICLGFGKQQTPFVIFSWTSSQVFDHAQSDNLIKYSIISTTPSCHGNHGLHVSVPL